MDNKGLLTILAVIFIGFLMIVIIQMSGNYNSFNSSVNLSQDQITSSISQPERIK